jgi:hypothetical protein
MYCADCHNADLFCMGVGINDQLSINQRISERKRGIVMVREKYAGQLAVVIVAINLMGVRQTSCT